jgi:hypothetical protein
MQKGSRRHRIIVVLVVFLLLPFQPGTAFAQAVPDTSDTECQESRSACIFGRLFAVFAAPYTQPFSALRATYEADERRILGARLEHRFRTLGASDERVHPYLGVGARLGIEQQKRGMAWRGNRVTTDADFEAVIGHQWAVAPLLRSLTSWDPPIVAATELQWRPFREADRVRAEVGPGLSLPLSDDRRLQIRVPISFPVGAKTGKGARFGISVVYNWK